MGKEKTSAEQSINTIRRKTQRKHSTEEKIRIVLEGLRGEDSISIRKAEIFHTPYQNC